MAEKDKRRKGNAGKSSALCVSKSISLPTDLIQVVDDRFAAEPEWDWSTYVRQLVRRDLATSEESKKAA